MLLSAILLLSGAARANTPVFAEYDSVMAVVEDPDSAMVEYGLVKDTLAEHVSKRLAASGVPVYPTSGSNPLVLDISIDSFKLNGGKVYAYNVSLQAQAGVAITVPPYTQTIASLWSVGSLGVSTTSDISKDITATVDSAADAFIREYNPQHPKLKP